MHYTPCATISLPTLVSNYHLLSSRLRQFSGKGHLWCVVKSNAYGHGFAPCVSALYHAGARYFAVGTLAEGITLRSLCPLANILILGVVAMEDTPALLSHNLTPTIPDYHYAKALSDTLAAPLPVHIKVDCGMGRLGLCHGETHSALDQILSIFRLPNLEIDGLYAHLPDADNPKSSETPHQIRLFSNLAKQIRDIHPLPHVHICASAGLLRYGVEVGQDARVGLALYGHSPSVSLSIPALCPVMTLRAPLLQIKGIAKGDRVGYGGTWTAPCDTRIGILPLGYGNGFLRGCEGGFVRVYGHASSIVGRISMNYTTIWLKDIPASAGDLATIFDSKGKQIKQLAEQAHTIPYELLSALRDIDYHYLRT